MDLVTLTEEIVKSLVVDTDAVSVKEFPTDEENVMLIQVMVAGKRYWKSNWKRRKMC